MNEPALIQMITYIPSNWEKKMKKKRGARGFISDSAYLRDLVNKDIVGS